MSTTEAQETASDEGRGQPDPHGFFAEARHPIWSPHECIRLFVYGDGNALRMKPAILRTTAWNRRLNCRTKTDPILVETMEAVDTAADV